MYYSDIRRVVSCFCVIVVVLNIRELVKGRTESESALMKNVYAVDDRLWHNHLVWQH